MASLTPSRRVKDTGRRCPSHNDLGAPTARYKGNKPRSQRRKRFVVEDSRSGGGDFVQGQESAPRGEEEVIEGDNYIRVSLPAQASRVRIRYETDSYKE